MKIAIITTGGRDLLRRWETSGPQLGSAVDALLQGFRHFPEHEVHVLMPMRRDARPPWSDGNTVFHDVPTPAWGMMKSLYLGAARSVRRKLREIQPDIVHGQGTERECGVCAVLSDFPNVLTIHGMMDSIARSTKARIGSFGWTAAMLERFTLPRTRGVFCNSLYVESLVRPLARKTWRVPNAIRIQFFDRPLGQLANGPAPILLNIGTIVPYKRQREVLELATALHREGLPFHLQFIGLPVPGSSYAARFFDQLDKVQADGFASFVGSKSLPDLIDSFDAARAVIHVPSEETFGLVAAEALSRNLKLFGTRVGGLVDVAESVDGAELFTLDQTQPLKAAIANWLKQGSARPQNARATMEERYHPRVIARRHLEIYEEVLS